MKSNLQAALEDLGYETRSYSGRGMYGKTCLAVTMDREYMLTSLTCGLMEIDPTLSRELKASKTDSMGLGLVIYFPDVEYSDED